MSWVDVLMNLGLTATQAAMCHVSTGWGKGPFNSELYNQLSPHLHLWMPVVAESRPPKVWLPAAMRPEIAMMEPTARPVPLMDASDLTEWWIRRVFPEQVGSMQLRSNMTHAEFLVLQGVYHLQKTFHFHFEDTPELGCCLSMIGAGAMAVIANPPCDMCGYRCAVYGTFRCGSCSRSKRVVNSDDVRNRAAEVRRARTVREAAAVQVESSDEDMTNLVARSVASMLYSMEVGHKSHTEWLAKVEAALDGAPSIKVGLPCDFLGLSHREQLKALQAVIDPNEWDYAAWPLKITQAQAWADGEAYVRGRRRGPGMMPNTRERLERARAMLDAGNSKTEVANSLGISLSNLSHLLRRSRAVKT